MEFQLGAEELVLLLAPAVAYWLYSGVYVVFGRTEAAAKYRLHSRKEEETKNLVSKKDVVKGVLLQHALQAAISFVVLKVYPLIFDSNVHLKIKMHFCLHYILLP